MDKIDRLSGLLSEQDRATFRASGYGADGGLGERPAVIVIDVSKAFCGERREPLEDSLKKWPNSCGDVAWDAIPHIQRLIDTAHARRIPVIHTTGQHPREDAFTSGRWTAKNPRLAMTPEASADRAVISDASLRNQIVTELAPQRRDIVIRKPKPSAFFGTALAGYLYDLRVDTLLLAGVATSGCVRATAVDAFSFNLKVGVVEEACFDRIHASHSMALFDLQSTYADVCRVEEAVTYLEERPLGLFDDRIDLSDSSLAEY